MCSPSTSSRERPNICSAARLNSRIAPCSSIVTIASRAEASIARLRASLSRSAASVRRRVVMSRAIVEAPTSAPSSSLIGEIVSETSIASPSLRTRMVS